MERVQNTAGTDLEPVIGCATPWSFKVPPGRV
jgi:hypothetical protein